MQSLGRYHDIMSHENLEQEFETVNNDISAPGQEGTHLYHLDDSYDSAMQQQRIAELQTKQHGNHHAGKQGGTSTAMTTSEGQTAATSGNHYFASRNFAASFAFDPDN